MSGFFDDLKKASGEAAKLMRDSVHMKDGIERYYWGIRLEAQVVAEVYHILREKGYSTNELYLEYWYNKRKNGEYKKMKADLMYGETYSVQLAEFKVMFDGHLYQDGSIKKNGRDIVKKEYGKLKDYSAFSEVSDLFLVVAYVGPQELYRKKVYYDSVLGAFDSRHSFQGIRGQPIEVIPC